MRILPKTLIAVLALGTALQARATDSTVSTNNKWAWSANAGWINCRPTATNGAIIGEFVCSGYLYSSVCGWIHLGDGIPTNGIRYSNDSAEDYGVNHDGEGHLSGFGWCASAGWINFEWTNAEAANAPKVDLKTGACSGYAWGGTLGWISLTNWSTYLQTVVIDAGSDTNTNGIPDAWEMDKTGSTTNLGQTAGADFDFDGMTDFEEYVADTDPADMQDQLRLTALSVPDGTNIQLRWSSRESRLYQIEKNTNLTNQAGWTNIGLSLYYPDTGTITTISISDGVPQEFFRIKAVRTLSP